MLEIQLSWHRDTHAMYLMLSLASEAARFSINQTLSILNSYQKSISFNRDKSLNFIKLDLSRWDLARPSLRLQLMDQARPSPLDSTETNLTTDPTKLTTDWGLTWLLRQFKLEPCYVGTNKTMLVKHGHSTWHKLL